MSDSEATPSGLSEIQAAFQKFGLSSVDESEATATTAEVERRSLEVERRSFEIERKILDRRYSLDSSNSRDGMDGGTVNF